MSNLKSLCAVANKIKQQHQPVFLLSFEKRLEDEHLDSEIFRAHNQDLKNEFIIFSCHYLTGVWNNVISTDVHIPIGQFRP